MHTTVEHALDARRLVEREMPGDGDCLFHSILDQLQQQGIDRFVDITLDPPQEVQIPTTAKGLRELAVRQLASMKDDYREFFLDDEFDDMLKQAAVPGSYDGNVHDYLATALAKALDIDVVVCEDNHQHSLNPDAVAVGSPELVITYRTFANWAGEAVGHYNSTEPAHPTTHFPWLTSLPTHQFAAPQATPSVSQIPRASCVQAPAVEISDTPSHAQPSTPGPRRRSYVDRAIAELVEAFATFRMELNRAINRFFSKLFA